ncbi:MAG: acetate kinase [Planctomycetota bacterium]
MKVLVLNCGSSSVKFLFYNMETETKLAKGLVERIGQPEAVVKFSDFKQNLDKTLPNKPDHDAAIREVINFLVDPKFKIIGHVDEIDGVGHRVVHGGENYRSSVLIAADVIEAIRELVPLAPLHNPANLTGIEVSRKLLPKARHVAVFDTAFHQSMAPEAFLYALPYSFYEKHKVRRYGFHGTSHFYISRRIVEAAGRDLNTTRTISAHLGNGCSICAIHNGHSVDTSMGLTPLEGLVMGTRSGDIDPGIIGYLIERGELSADPASPKFIDTVLNKKAGLIGISGLTNDLREIQDGMAKDHKMASLAFHITARRLKKYIAAYAAVMGGVDFLVFTGGIGENSAPMRRMATQGLEFMGLTLDETRNDAVKGEARISTDASPAQIWVLPTKEELVIARDTKRVITEKRKRLTQF